MLKIVPSSITKKMRVLKAIETNFNASKQYKDTFKLMQIFPYDYYPYPVILSEKVFNELNAKNGQNKQNNSPIEFYPYQVDLFKPMAFNDCTVIVVLLDRDYIVGSIIRGFNKINLRLLKTLGFRVVIIEKRLHRNTFENLLADRNSIGQNNFNKIIDNAIMKQK